MHSCYRVLSFGLVGLLVAGTHLPAQEIGYVESFALAEDRAKVLESLVPGTEDYYYFHCLHFQNTEQYGRVAELLGQWHEKFGWTPRALSIRHRQALLTYTQNPQTTLDYLRDNLGLSFTHQRELPEAERKLPNALPSQAVTYDAFRQRALRQNLTDGFEDRALERLAATDLNPDLRRHLLGRLQRPDLANLPALIAADLKAPNSAAFGSMPIHFALTQTQLDELRELLPGLANDGNFVSIYLSKLRPSEDILLAADAAAQRELLDRLWDFARTLAPLHNSLKAHLLYRQLELDRLQGRYDRERFLTYLRLPRQVFYLRPEFLQKVADGREYSDLNADFSQATRLPPIGNDEPLVADYLRHFFVEASDYRAFEEYVDAGYLRRLFAETKITHGLGDKQQWAAWLSPEQYQALLERVDLDFAWTNARQFRVDDPVELKLWVKNVDTLLVKVFEINTQNFYRAQLREIDSNLQLDGLVPHREEVFRYDEPPQRRLERTFRLDSIDHAGVYLVDFIGNGQSSRALIRKGQLQHLVQTTLAGQLFTIFDEDHRQVSDARVWISGQHYAANDLGTVLVPFSTQPGPTPVILERGTFAALSSFQHEAEAYQLLAAMFVDRESLVQNQTAQLAIRASLQLNGMPIPLHLLKKPRLVVQATDLDGIVSTREFPDLKLLEDAETIQAFQVPARLRHLQFRLQGEVDNVSRAEPQTLVAVQSFDVNAIEASEAIRDVYLIGNPSGFQLEVLGKTGEPRGRQAVDLALKHRDFREPYQLTLQTDDAGRIELGPLPEIQTVTATLSGTPARIWTLPQPKQTLSYALHAYAGEPIRVAYPDAATRGPLDFSLLELRGGTVVADHSSRITVTADGLEIAGLEGGDYQLHLKPSNEFVPVRVTRLAQAANDGGVIASAPHTRAIVGTSRLLETNPNPSLGIVSCTTQPESIVIRLSGTTPQSRVHLFANRYVTPFDPWSAWQPVRGPQLGLVRWGHRESSYVTGRDIGDEYRYILERKYAPKYPGVMVARPSLLLNPWATRDTENQVQIAQEGDDFGRSQSGTEGAAERPLGEATADPGLTDPSTFDFLATASPILLNLRPDPDGLVRIDRKLLGDKHYLQIVAVDDRSTAACTLWLEPAPAAVRDLRLAQGLDPERHFAQQKQISVLTPQQAFVLDDVASAKFQAFDDLGDVYRLFMALSQNPTLAEFHFILDWDSKTAAEKRALYSKYACHELNFYLFKKDPTFFQEVVGPFVVNKNAPQFVDLWLQGKIADPAGEPWAFQRLNTAEKILFGQTSAARREQVQRWIQSAYDYQPTPRQVFDRFFDTALKSGALDERGAAAEHDKDVIKMINRAVIFDDAKSGRDEVMNIPAPSAAPPAGGGAGGRLGRGDPAAAVANDEFGYEEGKSSEMRRAGKKAQAADGAPRDAEKQLADRNELAERESAQTRSLEAARKNLGVLAFYRRIPQTQEWVENDYYHLPRDQQVPQLVPVNRFWRDYAAHTAGQKFLSAYFPEATSSFSEMMFALAVLDLPLASQEIAFEVVDQQLRLKPASETIAFYQQVNPAAFDERGTSVLVSENFFRVDDRYRQEGAQRFDKFVTDEFLVHVLYGAQVVLTNPTSTPLAVDLLVQIPQGALPAAATQTTRTWQFDLQPFSTQTLEYRFYFPLSGQFAHYPAHVTLENRVIAAAQKLTFQVVDQATRADRSSWAYISQHGSDEDVLAFLAQENLNGIELSRIAFRLRDKSMFERVTALLESRLVYDQVVWSYSVHHDDRRRLPQFLAHCDDFLRAAGPALQGPLVTIDPVERHWYQHREYWPLANARAHRLGRTRQITNPILHDQYHQWLQVLACRRDFTPAERLQLAYYLLLQDRLAEAISQFDRIDPASVPQQLPYDYLASYVALLKEELEGAEQIARRRSEYPVERWAKLFQTVMAHVTEARGGQPDPSDPANREERQAELAAKQPGFEFEVEARQIQLHYQNLNAVTIHYYTMDVELLFSSNPFVHQRTEGFSIIRPNASQTVELPADQRQFTIDLPEAYRTANVLVEIEAAGQRKSKPYFAHALALSVNENYGQLRVLHQPDQRPLSKVYVKVYAQKADGTIAFYKDGYTDVRGRFDYVSLSNQPLDQVQRFSLLIASEEHGAMIQEAGIPKE